MSGLAEREAAGLSRGDGRLARHDRECAVVEAQAGEGRRDLRAARLERIARHDPYVWRAAGQKRRDGDDVVLDHHVRPHVGDDLPEPRLAVDRAVDERLDGRPDGGLELLDGGAFGTPMWSRG